MSELGRADVTDISFKEAIAKTDGVRRHLLLGNGFSMRADLGFGYDALYDVALGVDRSLAFLFQKLGVPKGDFETALRVSGEEERNDLREGLINTVSKIHPNLTRAHYETCAWFLNDFVSPKRGQIRGTIFTTNYDLLLYRALIAGRGFLECYDSFDSDGYWNTKLIPNSHVFYWHGALHIFQRDVRPLDGSERNGAERYVKLHADLGDPLVAKIDERLRAGDLPLYVAEGTAEEKQIQIGRHDYLRKIRRRFGNVCNLPNTALFTVGHSLSPVDQHIVDKIGASGLEAVYVGWFTRADRMRVKDLAAQWTLSRAATHRPAIDVYAFDTRECRIWEIDEEAAKRTSQAASGCGP